MEPTMADSTASGPRRARKAQAEPLREPDLFDLLRFSEQADDLEEPLVPTPFTPAPPSALSSPAEPLKVRFELAPEPEEPDELVVDLPEVFERPHSPLLDEFDATETITRHRLDEGPPPPAAAALRRVSGSGSGARLIGFSIATSAFFLLFLAFLAIVFPKSSADFFRSAANRLDPAAPAESPAAPPAPVAQSDEANLRQRIELIALEDRAIAEGDRAAFVELERLANSPALAKPHRAAAQAGLIRVRRFFAATPAAETKPLDSRSIYGVDSETALPQPVVIQVLRDPRQPIDSRRRAAVLLAQNPTSPAKKALFNTIQDDPNLEVVKQAFAAFRSATDYPGQELFDFKAIDSWWTASQGGALGQNQTQTGATGTISRPEAFNGSP